MKKKEKKRKQRKSKKDESKKPSKSFQQSVPYQVVDLQVYRIARRVYWTNAFMDRETAFEEIYDGILKLSELYARDEPLFEGTEPIR